MRTNRADNTHRLAKVGFSLTHVCATCTVIRQTYTIYGYSYIDDSEQHFTSTPSSESNFKITIVVMCKHLVYKKIIAIGAQKRKKQKERKMDGKRKRDMDREKQT